MNLTEFHRWLFDACKSGPVTVLDLMADFDDMKAAKVLPAWAPPDGITCQGWLERLQSQGKATRDGSYWRWAEGRTEAVERQKGLF